MIGAGSARVAGRPGAAGEVVRARRPRRRASRTVAAWTAALVTAAALSGCAAARNELGTVNSDCYIAIPAAFRAVHHHGRLAGVRLVSVASLRTQAPLLYEAARSKGKSTRDVCLVAFTGEFLAESVTVPVGDTAGSVAVVELGYPAKRLFATLVLRRPPIPFGHFHL